MMNFILFLLSLTCAYVFASPTFAAPTVGYGVSRSHSSPYLTRFIEPDVGGMTWYLKRFPGFFWREPEEDIFHARALEDTVFVSVRPARAGTREFVVGNQILGIAEDPRTPILLSIAPKHNRSYHLFMQEK
ncbi:hypothetical protein DFS33DRAFT_1337908 [Desarmillaria ectypa]|nr:hypothetical protein DFS33DRAFT_1337908 [Desarmillaria ectypa]